jgi:hypothetical protein
MLLLIDLSICVIFRSCEKQPCHYGGPLHINHGCHGSNNRPLWIQVGTTKWDSIYTINTTVRMLCDEGILVMTENKDFHIFISLIWIYMSIYSLLWLLCPWRFLPLLYKLQIFFIDGFVKMWYTCWLTWKNKVIQHCFVV